MSNEAQNWVLRDCRTRSVATQCLLLVLANAADPEGVAFGWWDSRDHWWPYLVERTRLSRGTLFKLLNELEGYGYFTREQAKPKGGGKAQPVIRLHIDRKIMEPDAPADSQSPTETEQAERAPSETPSQSPTETENDAIESHPETETVAASLPGRPIESGTETARDVPVIVPTSPQSPPSDKSHRPPTGLDEANGFAAFWGDYPERQTFNRQAGLRSYAELTESDQEQAQKTVAFYARDIAKTKRRPVSPANWLKDRRFTEYGVGRQTGGANAPLQVVPEGTPPWNAWIAVASVAYGGGRKVPHYWGAQSQRGIWRPTQWPLGADVWLTPVEHWIFVELGTAQNGRWRERIAEMLQREPIQVKFSTTRPARVIEHSAAGPISLRPLGKGDPQGLLVPSEWPPPKGEKKTETPKTAAA